VLKVLEHLMKNRKGGDASLLFPVEWLPDEASKSQLLRAMASPPLRMSLETMFGVRLAYRWFKGMALFSPKDQVGYDQFINDEAPEDSPEVLTKKTMFSAMSLVLEQVSARQKMGLTLGFEPWTTGRYSPTTQGILTELLADDRNRLTLINSTQCASDCGCLVDVGLVTWPRGVEPDFRSLLHLQLFGKLPNGD
jgi:hypothetical protein